MSEYAQAEAERIMRTVGDRKSEDRLVAVLAAAIDVSEWVDRSPTMRGYIPDRGSTRGLLAAQVEALSELRMPSDGAAS